MKVKYIFVALALTLFTLSVAMPKKRLYKN